MIDAILIGAGPIGLEMAVALQDAGVEYRHLEAQYVGHTISWYPRQVRFFSSPERIAICGVPLTTADQSKATREEYLAYLWGIVQQFQLPIQLYERVVAIERPGEYFVVTTETADRTPATYEARHVIVAMGDMHRPRPLRQPNGSLVPGADLPHVHPYFEEPFPYAGVDLLVIGGRNSAIEAAIRCHRAGARVSVSYRRAAIDESVKYWLKPEFDWLVKQGTIRFFPQTVPVHIEAGHTTLAKVSPNQQIDADSMFRVPATFVLPLIGFEMNMNLLTSAGVALHGPNGAPHIDSATMETNVKGLFVAGTAAAGTQLRYRLFIENCHSHVVRILRAIAGRDPQHISPLAYSRLHESPAEAEN